jgi:hypothetical protein
MLSRTLELGRYVIERDQEQPFLAKRETMVATRTDTHSPALHVADSHDLIRVQGARCPSLFTRARRR